jgi:DNA-binding NarL/FixJ family response regulator
MKYPSDQAVSRNPRRPSPPRVLVVDDSELLRRVICKLLKEQSDIEIVCEASNGAEAVDKAREHRPDVVLLDIAMPIMNGLCAAHLIRNTSPSTKILMLTQFDSKAFMREADTDIVNAVVGDGALGYVLKTDAGRELCPL